MNNEEALKFKEIADCLFDIVNGPSIPSLRVDQYNGNEFKTELIKTRAKAYDCLVFIGMIRETTATKGSLENSNVDK